jgi:hypothetical protein
MTIFSAQHYRNRREKRIKKVVNFDNGKRNGLLISMDVPSGMSILWSDRDSEGNKIKSNLVIINSLCEVVAEGTQKSVFFAFDWLPRQTYRKMIKFLHKKSAI